MKFRGKMADAAAVRQLTNLASTMAKMKAGAVTLRLSKDVSTFSLCEDGGSRVVCWCTLEQKRIFTELTLEGATVEQNQICLLLSPASMASALTSAKNALGAAKSVKIKLTNKKCPCLTFEIDLPSVGLIPRTCVHDVPVILIPRLEWPLHEPPQVSDPNVSLSVAAVKKVRTVIDRLRKLSSKLHIQVTSIGGLCLRTETDSGTFATYFQNLPVVYSDDDNDGTLSVSLWIDAKKLAQLLASDQLNPDHLVFGVVNEKLLHVILTQDDLNLHYIIPAISL
ncbi:checkpoint protein HUS1 [Neocloeon triangulifer]|uniref:checkpoint protein HUS1 n=1 Tax=Neocloeon triangulifer TaxID=2078957 RepID=UPI00286F779E|nr:checkpoint protein HUS1 [Neocloeon triangulifer]XP_059470559.1 checkpoint protein HUS1 [Neocloeon triangulifer]